MDLLMKFFSKSTWSVFIFALLCYVFAICPCFAQDRLHWYRQAKAQILKNMKDQDNSAIAKNIILFIGDGMGLTTVTTARILRGQLKGLKGEEYELAFDKFQYVALAKTYNTDSQVGDSGACATALLCGVKGRFETVGLDDSGVFNRCDTNARAKVASLAEWAQTAGKSTGLVTTARVTHATPAAMYAHLVNRYWEGDEKLANDTSKTDCKDIARQLIEDDPGRNINVILGGGRRYLLPRLKQSDSMSKKEGEGRREDGRNLIEEWIKEKKARGLSYKYVARKKELEKVDPHKVDYLLGLFTSGHMAYESDRDKDSEPSLAQMTTKAIEILRRNSRGYFLMVEGGRIDHSHHFNNAHRALVDTLAFEDAIIAALEMTRKDETLMVVTSDHSHVFVFGGYPKRGNPIFGLDDKPSDVDGLPYTTLIYANGPGYNQNSQGGRENLTSINTEDKNYIQQSAVPRRWDTHGGEDVPVYAEGPMSHLFRGVFEQTYVPHALAFASCIGPQKDDCERRKQTYQRHVIECPSPHVVREVLAYRSDSYRVLSTFLSVTLVIFTVIGNRRS
ncbi:alkaline phosphatase [Parasteatoda tepidariorum]|uniref:alkaline phosphatase n=1 Tax=Parasteatoda tepidariorum TaxID=114398 RepID=UPI00077FA3E4|nr:alkaline phosphatase isoform X1 [Parasteatoda tepidariorum]